MPNFRCNQIRLAKDRSFKILGLAKKMKINNYHLRKWQNVNWVRKLSYVSWINQQLKLIKTRYGSKMHSMYNLCDWIYHFSSQFSFRNFVFYKLEVFDWVHNHTSANFISMVVTRAISNFSKIHTFFICRMHNAKMGGKIGSSLDMADDLKVVFFGQIS